VRAFGQRGHAPNSTGSACTASHATSLTAAEQRVAELAASGLTNRQVATALFMSPKTVEANLAHVYNKLGIRSRAQLGARVRGIEQENSQN
jgi:DNA-binding NarL/FixJ family response regulator